MNNNPATSRYSLLLVCLGIALIAQFRPIDDNDISWQIKLGQLMWERGDLIRHDPFTYTHAGDAVPTVGWLAQYLFYLCYSSGGWYLAHLLAIVLLVTGFITAGVLGCDRQDDTPPRSVVVGMTVALGYLAAATNLGMRPQLIALCCFALLLWIGWRRSITTWKLFGYALPLLLFWQNCHPSIITGAVALGPIMVWRWFDFMVLRKKGNDQSAWAEAHGSEKSDIRTGTIADRPKAPWILTILLLLIGLVQFATPEGGQIFAVSKINLIVSRDWLRAEEWLPAFDPAVAGRVPFFWVGLAVSLALIARLRRGITIEEYLLFGVMSALGLYAARFVVFWAVAMIPLWMRWLELAIPTHWFREIGPSWPAARWRWVLSGATILTLIIPPLTRAATVMSLFHRDLPLAGIAFLKEHVPAGRIYNYREYGGPLILEGYPQWQVAIDGRLYIFTREDWREYNRAARGEIPIAMLIEKHQPAAFFLRSTFDRQLIVLLKNEPDWYEAYRDEATVIFLPKTNRVLPSSTQNSPR
ncbi:MAG: hypothetical protein HJJLKODD_00120 [Phycisphaerae bacterium]|nr:hypothetical protein [Phycisphaerae bacterium]